jgi:hypothetical protein
MIWKWSYFLAAAVFAAYFLLRGGVPPIAIAAGLAGAAFLTWRKSRTA